MALHVSLSILREKLARIFQRRSWQQDHILAHFNILYILLYVSLRWHMKIIISIIIIIILIIIICQELSLRVCLFGVLLNKSHPSVRQVICLLQPFNNRNHQVRELKC